METYELLKELVETPGISGDEGPIRGKIMEILRGFGFTDEDMEVDRLGNLKVRVRGASEAPTVAFMAHMDETGFVVRDIDDNGYLYVENVGGVDVRTIIGQAVVFYRRPRKEGETWRERAYYGVIGVKPVHLLSEEERKKVPSIKELFVDVGLYELLRDIESASERRKRIRELGIAPGDLGHLVKHCIRLRGDLVVGRALDDRAGCAAIILALREIKRLAQEGEIPLTVFGVFTSQEEVGARGSRVAAYSLWSKSPPEVGNPDIAIIIDVTHASGYPGFETKDFARIELGRGPTISRGPPVHVGLSDIVIEYLRAVLGDEPQIQYESGRTRTDLDEVQIVRHGAMAVVVGIPLKYMHTGVEVVSLRDIEKTAELLVHIAKNIKHDLSRLMP